MKNVKIYTDGACSGNPGPGGWGAILSYGDANKECSGYEAETTNNRMELMAAIVALEMLKESCQVEVYSDSAYLVNAFLKGWLENWQKNGWLTSKKQPVENQDLWQRLLIQAKKHEIKWFKVKGHTDHPENNRCDFLAKQAVQNKEGA